MGHPPIFFASHGHKRPKGGALKRSFRACPAHATAGHRTLPSSDVPSLCGSTRTRVSKSVGAYQQASLPAGMSAVSAETWKVSVSYVAVPAGSSFLRFVHDR